MLIHIRRAVHEDHVGIHCNPRSVNAHCAAQDGHLVAGTPPQLAGHLAAHLPRAATSPSTGKEHPLAQLIHPRCTPPGWRVPAPGLRCSQSPRHGFPGWHHPQSQRQQPSWPEDRTLNAANECAAFQVGGVPESVASRVGGAGIGWRRRGGCWDPVRVIDPAIESHYGTGYERSRLFPGGRP